MSSTVIATEPLSINDSSWTMFEEIVSNNTLCYGNSIGEVTASNEVGLDDSTSLLVHANKNLSSKSNHVLAQYKVADEGRTGIWKYETYAYIDPDTARQGQAGPELSMQNTREITPSAFKTMIVGIQYRTNPFAPDYGQWAIWTEENANTADWKLFFNQTLENGTWYKITLVADFTSNNYVSLSVIGGSINLTLDLSSYNIVMENKFSEEAFWLTLESENLWNNCGTAGNTTYKMHYDNTTLREEYSTFSINLTSGWNLISFPLKLSNTSIDAVMQGCTYHRVWTLDNGWTSTDTGLTTVDHVHGYFIDRNNLSSCTLNLSGYALSKTNLTLNDDWTLIGYPSLTSRNVSSVFDANDYRRIWQFSTAGWSSTDTTLRQMTPGRGYFIHANQSREILISP